MMTMWCQPLVLVVASLPVEMTVQIEAAKLLMITTWCQPLVLVVASLLFVPVELSTFQNDMQ